MASGQESSSWGLKVKKGRLAKRHSDFPEDYSGVSLGELEMVTPLPNMGVAPPFAPHFPSKKYAHICYETGFDRSRHQLQTSQASYLSPSTYRADQRMGEEARSTKKTPRDNRSDHQQT